MSSNFIKLDEALNANICLSYYKPDLNNYKIDIETNLKRQQEKFNILKEILSSEKKYLSDIREIVEGYYEELRKSCPEDVPFDIFSNIKEILEFTKVFYCLLESSTNDEAGIATCFIKKHKTFLKLYSTYCQNYKKAFNIAERLEKEHKTSKVIQKVRLKYGHCLKLATYLQLPVLRITKYHLLLQRYLKLLDKESQGYRIVQEALTLMKQVNDQINNDMPKDDDSKSYERITSTSNIQNLIKLFGSILKQGNLVLNETKKVHYVIVFQTLLVIRKSDSPYKVLHSISNEYLALMPKSSCSSKSKYFNIIDYSQSKGNELWQFTFKARSLEDKQSWQSSILSCMLNGYGKKLSDSIRSKVMKMDSISESKDFRKSSNDIFRQKLNNIKKMTEFRSSVKPEINDTLKHFGDLKEEQKRRYSSPHSRFSKIFDRTIENGTMSLRRLINKSREDYRLDKLFSKENASYETESECNTFSAVDIENFEQQNSFLTESLETPRESQCLDQDLNSSFEEISNCTDESEKVLNKNNDNYQPDTLSKTSMNSEEGYFSNHDSSTSTLVMDPVVPNDDSMCTLKNFPLTVSTPELFKQINLSEINDNVFDSKNKFNLNDKMTTSMKEPLDFFSARIHTDPVQYTKNRSMCLESKNLSRALHELSNSNTNCSEMLSASMTSFSRIKNLCNIFEEQQDVSECRDISKSINYLQENPVPKRKLITKFLKIENNQTSTSENEIFRPNIKELINKFENNSNKSNF